MNKFIIGAVVLAVVLILSARYFNNDQEEVASAVTSVSSALSVVEEPYNFGDIDIFGGKVETTYTLKNEGDEDITITKAGTSCMCTEGVIAGLTFGMHSSEVDSIVIPAGGEEKVRAIYDPLAHGPNGTGPVTRELMLATNSVVTPEVRMRFSGNVIKNEQ
tara:strand:+ start:671 stop:1153 length:483 start_codon:yes stop_codon:yes gene_type:complete